MDTTLILMELLKIRVLLVVLLVLVVLFLIVEGFALAAVIRRIIREYLNGDTDT